MIKGRKTEKSGYKMPRTCDRHFEKHPNTNSKMTDGILVFEEVSSIA